MNGEVLVLNPKRRGRRKMTAAQRKYFGPRRRGSKRRRRNPVLANAPGKRFVTRRVSRRYAPYVVRRRRRNPPALRGVLGTGMQVVQDAVPSAAGIVANNFLTNVVGDALNLSGTNKEILRAGMALALPTVVGMAMPRYKRTAAVMGAAALAMQAVHLLEETVFPTLGTVGDKLSSRSPRTVGPVSPGVRGIGYLPGHEYSQFGYLPGHDYTMAGYDAERELTVH